MAVNHKKRPLLNLTNSAVPVHDEWVMVEDTKNAQRHKTTPVSCDVMSQLFVN